MGKRTRSQIQLFFGFVCPFHFTPARANLAKVDSWTRKFDSSLIADVKLLQCLQRASKARCRDEIAQVLQFYLLTKMLHYSQSYIPFTINYGRLNLL